MTLSPKLYRNLTAIFWSLAALAILCWALVPGYVVGWDLNVIRDAVLSIRAGHDPYTDALARQEAFRALLQSHPNSAVPFSYVYSPITLPALRIAARLPLWFTGLAYWAAYIAATGALLWFGLRFVEERERNLFATLVPVALFFPGLLQNDVIFSANVAIILYALVFVAAWHGWRRERWLWFYAAVVFASFFKAPMLSLVCIAAFSSRKQWLPSFLAAIAGVALFAGQRFLWPELFTNYMKTLDDMFVLGKDFSSSPSGLVAQALLHTVSYRITLAVVYLLVALPVAATLAILSKRFAAGRFSLKQWAPVLIVGVVLLNPRIIEYDVAPLTLLMALIAWRLFGQRSSTKKQAIKASIFFVAINACAAMSVLWPPAWRVTECLVLLGLFVAGAWQLASLEAGAHGSNGAQA